MPAQECVAVPAKPRFNKATKSFRLDAESLKALEKLITLHGKSESKIMREALIEKAQRDIPTETQPR